MNDLQKYFPNNQLQSLMDDLAINSWDDFARRFLLGDGKSAGTYKTYMVACKQFYDFTGGMHPMQAGSPEMIEQYYDSLTVDRNTKAIRIAALKFMYRKICERFPFYTSPFDAMSEKLKKKITKKKQAATKGALTRAELNRLLGWLSGRMDPRGRLCYGLIYMMSTTGLRAAELCGLRWADIEEIDGTYYANGTGKGEKEFHQEVYKPALRAIKRRGEYLFYRLSDPGRPLDPHSLWYQITEVGKEAREAGIIAENRRITFSPHLFRRTYCTLLEKSGMPLSALQGKSRHSSVDTLLKHYVDHSEPAAPYLDKILNSA